MHQDLINDSPTSIDLIGRGPILIQTQNQHNMGILEVRTLSWGANPHDIKQLAQTLPQTELYIFIDLLVCKIILIC